MPKKTQRRKSTQRKKRPTKSKQSKENTVKDTNKFTDVARCVELFKRYKLTGVKQLIRWMNKNHPDKLTTSGKQVSEQLKEDYKEITGCFAKRKEIFQKLKSGKPMTQKKKSKAKALGTKKTKSKPFSIFSIF